MKTATEISTRVLVPVHDTTGCVGHLLRSARGFRAFDAMDKQIGIYATAGDGVVALLERSTGVAQ
jgi:hypothetical protein